MPGAVSPDAGRGQTDAHCHLCGSPLCPSRRAPRCCLGSFPIQLPAAPLSPHVSTQVPMIYKSGLFLLNLSALNRHGVAGTAVPLKHEACCHPPYKPPRCCMGKLPPRHHSRALGRAPASTQQWCDAPAPSGMLSAP